MRTRPATYAALAALAAILGVLAGCNLPGLPGVRDAGPGPDAGIDAEPPEDTAGETGRVCQPGDDAGAGNANWPRCSPSGGVMRCVDDGRNFEITPCGDHEICQDGKCRPVENQCDTPLPFRLSKSSLAFKSNGRLRSDSDSVVVENCSDFEIMVDRAAVQYTPAGGFPPDLTAFSIDNRFPLDGVALPPGDQIRVRVEYAPEFGFFVEREASLLLDVRASQPYVTELPMNRRLHCVSTAPDIDLGELEKGEKTRVEVPVYNCGTVDAAVERPEPERVPSDAIALSAPDDARPTQIVSPGETVEFPLDLKARGSGEVDVTIPMYSTRAAPNQSRQRELISPTFHGQVAADDCAETSRPAPPEYRRADDNAGDGTGKWSSGRNTTMAPGRELLIRPAEADGDETEAQFQLASRPDRSRTRLRPNSSHLRIRPDVPGTYVVTDRRTGDDGRPGCESGKFTLQVRPDAPLYVELDWTTRDDPIPTDHGYGRGVDLDLHVRRDADDIRAGWNGRSDCFQRGTEATNSCVRSVSVSGGGLEAVAYDELDDATFDVAVQAWNTYRFPGAEADIRVYTDGELHEGFPMTARFGRAAGTIWHVGEYDPEADQFVEDDEIQKGFER